MTEIIVTEEMAKVGIQALECDVDTNADYVASIYRAMHAVSPEEKPMTTDQEKSATPSSTYPTPEHGWVCFHCGEHFSGTYEGQKRAKAHFGTNPESKTLCLINEKYGLAKWQRYLEDKNKELELANIQLREELAIAKEERDIATESEREGWQHLKNKLSAATEQLTAMTKVASDHRDGRLAANEQLAQEAEIRADMESFIEIISERLGVSQEPHQSFNDRLLDSCLEMGAMTKARDFEKEAHENTRVYLSAEIDKLKTSLVTKNEQLAIAQAREVEAHQIICDLAGATQNISPYAGGLDGPQTQRYFEIRNIAREWLVTYADTPNSRTATSQQAEGEKK